VCIDPPFRMKSSHTQVMFVALVCVMRMPQSHRTGTDANIFIDIYGRRDNGVEESDHIDLKKAVKSSFERGSVDKFSYDIKVR
jgi:hypothetical protein